MRIHPADSVISVKDSSFWAGVLHNAVQQCFGKSITVVFCVKEHLDFLPIGSKPLCDGGIVLVSEDKGILKQLARQRFWKGCNRKLLHGNRIGHKGNV